MTERRLPGLTVFILGAGFTKAFCPRAPLLYGNYPLKEQIAQKYAKFPIVQAILDDAWKDPTRINLESLLTRLSARMPYDSVATSDVLKLAYQDVVRVLRHEIETALFADDVDAASLFRFIEVFGKTNGYIITFNYDDLVERGYFAIRNRTGQPVQFTSVWAYGFFGRSAESAVLGMETGIHGMSRRLFKLHGSLNWRLLKGTPRPVPLGSVLTWQTWERNHTITGYREFVEAVEEHLEPEPFILPPILTKSGLLGEPVLRMVWERAFSALREAERIVFLGYSLPLTDVSTGYLFREATRHIRPENIEVIDFNPNPKDSDAFGAHRETVIGNYRNVFPEIAEEQFNFDGAVSWVNRRFAELGLVENPELYTVSAQPTSEFLS